MAGASGRLITPSRPGYPLRICRCRAVRQPYSPQRQRNIMADDTSLAHADIPPGNASRRRLIASAGILFVLPVIPTLAKAATIVAVRTWPADEYTRVTLEMDSELKAEHFALEKPDRLVVDIQGLSLNSAINDLVSKIKPNDPYIETVRVGQNRPGVVRLVLDLKQPIAPQVFTLKPIGAYKYQIGRAHV